jgi:hypothetical protein
VDLVYPNRSEDNLDNEMSGEEVEMIDEEVEMSDEDVEMSDAEQQDRDQSKLTADPNRPNCEDVPIALLRGPRGRSMTDLNENTERLAQQMQTTTRTKSNTMTTIKNQFVIYKYFF